MIKVLVIAGQTATGKTQLANQLAHKFNGELISADSRQVYKGMDIITGKDRNKIDVPIWLYDLVKSNELFNVSQWYTQAVKAINDIHQRNKLPIVVGGTGLYLRSLKENLSNIEVPPNEKLRSQNLNIEQLQELLGFTELKKLNSSDKQNPRRLIRKIELKNVATEAKKEDLDILSFVLHCEAEELKKRIASRVDKRLDAGALQELENPTVNTLGRKNKDDWIRSEYQYARRQKTFFKKYFPEHFFNVTSTGFQDQIIDIISIWLSPLNH